MQKILIVEDDVTIAGTVAGQLSLWGYQVKNVTDFQNVLQEFAAFAPHLVLMDLSLPFYNGFHWCDEIRRLSQVPIIFLSSAADNMNMVMAISRGADDFIAKPFDMAVLVAKVQAMMRRAYSFGNSSNLLEYNGVILNLSDSTLTWEDKSLELTRNEFRILQVLFENSGKIVPRETIMTKLWEDDSFIDDNTLTVNVNRLRKKLESIGLRDFISTKKGQGYRI